jgi:hypothetical protein
MQRCKVWPGRPGVKLTHPSGVELKPGASWPRDQFTARRLIDGDITDMPPVSEAAAVVEAPQPVKPRRQRKRKATTQTG